MKQSINGYSFPGAIIISCLFFALLLFIGCDSDDGTGPGPNVAPSVPSNPVPADGSVNQDLGRRLEWVCTDDDNDLITYDFYFGTTSQPDYDTTLDTYLYNHDRLEYLTTYYWQVIADDGQGHEVIGPIWSFTTGMLYLVDDFPTNNNMHKVVVRDDGIIFVADDNFGMRIMDVTDTSMAGVRIDSVGTYRSGGFNLDIAIDGDVAYLATNEGVRLYDVSNPALPDSLFYTDGSFMNLDTDEVRAIMVMGDYAYSGVVTPDTLSDNDTSYIKILDVSNLNDVTLVGELKFHGIANDVCVSGDYAFIPDSLNGLQVFDVSDPTDPTLELTYVTNDFPNAIFIEGTIAYIGDGDAGLLILNISTPTSPSVLGQVETPGHVRDVYKRGNFVYMANYWNGGLRIVNVSDPMNPELVTGRDTPGGASGIFVDEDYIYFADRWAGLLLFEFSLN